MKKKLSDMLTARKENSNKGFTLVELIVVIVILAILIGVTIGGVFGYVNKSRINTDINNAAALSSALATCTVSKDIGNSKWAAVSNEVIADPNTDITATNLAKKLLKPANGGDPSANQIKVIENLIPDGVGKTKYGDLVANVTVDTDGHITAITVNAYEHSSTTSKLTAQE